MLTLPSYLTVVERAVLTAILEGAKEHKQILQQQILLSELKSRDFNGHGFYTDFSIPEELPRYPSSREILHASAVVDGELCGFILWVIDGQANSLEGYPLDGDSCHPDGKQIEQVKLG
ncbi:MAG TPA: hypothetical protein VFC39_11340 [Acidobacteriaceae bacterium]|nr:hypothetical protein [Acidobacteriaceae bacterium]